LCSYRVGDNKDVGVRAGVGASSGQVADDGGVGVEEVVTGHSRLAGNTGGDENDLSASQALLEVLVALVVALDSALGVDVADISGDTGCATDIVESELSNSGVELEEEGERLTNTTSSTEDSDTGVLNLSISIWKKNFKSSKLQCIRTSLAEVEKARAAPKTLRRAANMIEMCREIRMREMCVVKTAGWRIWICKRETSSLYPAGSKPSFRSMEKRPPFLNTEILA